MHQSILYFNLRHHLQYHSLIKKLLSDLRRTRKGKSRLCAESMIVQSYFQPDISVYYI